MDQSMTIDTFLVQLRNPDYKITYPDVANLYTYVIRQNAFKFSILRRLEQAGFLEQVLLPMMQQLTHELAFTFIAIINIKHLEQVGIWDSKDKIIYARLIDLFNFIVDSQWSSFKLEEKSQAIQFLMQLYAYPEVSEVSKNTLRCLSAAILTKADKIYLKHHFLKFPQMIQSYIDVLRVKGIQNARESCFIDRLVQDFIQVMLSYPVVEKMEVEHQDPQNKFRDLIQVPLPQTHVDNEEFKLPYRNCSPEQIRIIKYIERFVDFLTQLLSSVPTRKYLRLYLLSLNIVPTLKVSILHYHSSILSTLVDLLEHYLTYPLNDLTGEPLSVDLQTIVHKDFLKETQSVLFRMFKLMLQQRELEEFQFIKELNKDEASQLFFKLNLPFPQELPRHLYEPGKNFAILLKESLGVFCSEPVSESPLLTTPIIPADDLIWDYKRIPEESSYGFLKQTLAIPKLNLQFLSLDDYLERNYWLYKLESAYDLRKDLEDAITRMSPAFDQLGRLTNFDGWARMATEIKKFKVHNVQPPNIGRLQPKSVVAEVQFSVDRMSLPIRKEWDSLKKHDVIFLVSFHTTERSKAFLDALSLLEQLVSQIEENKVSKLFCERMGIRSVRGGTIDSIYDERRIEIQDWDQTKENKYQGQLRVLNISMDTAQYQEDLEDDEGAEGEVYGNFKLLIRRKPKENNFKAVLESIHDVLEEKPQLPQFLNEILLGYGDDENTASYKQMHKNPQIVKFKLYDTFIDEDHFNESFINNNSIPQELKQSVKYEKQPKNLVRFTPEQTTAITSAMYPGLNLVVGPPGTGKTDITVQIANLLYKNFQNKRTLIITHSNHALNDIFEKISLLDINEKHLLRLGQGERDLKLPKSYSKQGRITFMLSQRLELLRLVADLQQTLPYKFTEEFNCQLAGIYNQAYVKTIWNEYQNKKIDFPFKVFVDQHLELFENQDSEEKQYQVIEKIFSDVEECMPFEILRNKRERGNYILCHQSRIVAMTCTHAALKRKSFIELKLKFENIIIEEAGQILEIEAFLPMTISKYIERISMIGDNNQLPPIVKNISFQKSANLEQSFFIRMLRLGVYSHELYHQGRARLELLQLYQWKYGQLTSLPICLPIGNSPFAKANAGFTKLLQFVDVDYQGVGESRPSPYIYQNIAEAEFIVATYMYMVLIGYDPSKISIITTYNGQKLLIKDIIQRKCSWHSLFKEPAKITTVDKYQGQQNDYILLSMVRTESIGYLRDCRRMIVAFSRAKLGLYVFGKYNLFNWVPEYRKCFQNLNQEGLKLNLNEKFPSTRNYNEQVQNTQEIRSSHQMYEIVKQLLE